MPLLAAANNKLSHTFSPLSHTAANNKLSHTFSPHSHTAANNKLSHTFSPHSHIAANFLPIFKRLSSVVQFVQADVLHHQGQRSNLDVPTLQQTHNSIITFRSFPRISPAVCQS